MKVEVLKPYILAEILYLLLSPLRVFSWYFLRKSFLDLFPYVFRSILMTLFLTSRLSGERKVSLFLSKLKGEIFINIGAEYGHYSLMLSKNFKKVLAFELSPKAFPHLVNNIRISKAKNILALKCALSDKDGISSFYIATKRGYDSLIRRNGIKIKEVVKVRAFTLATIFKAFHLSKADLVKVDVEGAEYMVLKGAEPVVEKIKSWIVEIHDISIEREVIKYFLSHDYRVVKLDYNHIFAFK
jgi:FkbM family methyltransferase